LIARALLPAIEGLLERGVTVGSDELARAYLAAARVMYEGGTPRPVDYLHSQVAIAQPRFSAAQQRLNEATNTGYPYLRAYAGWGAEAEAFVRAHPLASAALLLGSDERPDAIAAALGAAPKEAERIAAAAARARGFAYGLARTPKSYAFVLVARDPAAMEELVARFVELRAVGEGILLELAR
jgi:hypothetical protein